jgi:serine/threonine protein kinase
MNNFLNINDKINIQKNKLRQLKEYYKTKTNLYNYLKNRKCSQFLEDFELLDYISSGCSGVVYKGCNRKNLDDPVCLKFLLNKLDSEEREKQFNKDKKDDNIENKQNNAPILEEIKIQQKFHHKNIAKYYDYCDLKDYGCIIMELAEYGDLNYIQKKLIQQNCLSETFLAYITKQILDGLFYIHKLKIIHMDIKPHNILINKNLEIKITDFSVSLSYEKTKNSEKIKLPLTGTNPFMSPEVLNKEQIDIEDASKIDMFSLGIMLYHLAFEEFPYDLNINVKKNFRQAYEKIKYKNLEFPKNKSKSGKYSNLFIKFLKNLLDNNIKNRISVFDALDEPWIKATNLIYQEKEKSDIQKFLMNITTDNIRTFNVYINGNNSEASISTN